LEASWETARINLIHTIKKKKNRRRRKKEKKRREKKKEKNLASLKVDSVHTPRTVLIHAYKMTAPLI